MFQAFLEVLEYSEHFLHFSLVFHKSISVLFPKVIPKLARLPQVGLEMFPDFGSMYPW